MTDLNASVLAVSFVLTWVIGLAPPLLIRYVFIKRRINKWPAIGACIFFWVINVVIFTAMGSQSKTHGALLFVAFVSYWILCKKTNEHQIRSASQGITSDKLPTKDPKYVRCSNCDFEQWAGYEICQKCGARLK